MPPNVCSAGRARAATASGSVTSVGTTRALPDLLAGASDLFEHGTAPGSQNDARTVQREGEGGRAANAARGSRDDEGGSSEVVHGEAFSWLQESIDRFEAAADFQKRTGHERRIRGQKHI